MVMEKKVKVLISKIGLDGHDRGAKVVSAMLRDYGMEVIYLGRFQTPEAVVASAVQEDVDVIGLSCLSGEHLSFTPSIIDLLKQNHADHIQLVIGGIIPRQDVTLLKQMGVSEVFTGGSTSDRIAEYMLKAAEKKYRLESSPSG